MNNKKTIKILQEAYKSCCTGIRAFDTVIPKASSTDLRNTLSNRRTQYKKLAHDISCELSKMHSVPHEMNTLEQIGLTGILHIDTFAHPSDTGIALIIINGSTEGITDLNSSLNQNAAISQTAKGLCNRLIKCEMDNIDFMKKYL